MIAEFDYVRTQLCTIHMNRSTKFVLFVDNTGEAVLRSYASMPAITGYGEKIVRYREIMNLLDSSDFAFTLFNDAVNACMDGQVIRKFSIHDPEHKALYDVMVGIA